MDEIESKTSKKINSLKLGDIYKTLNNSINNLQNDINLLNYLESSIAGDKQLNNISQSEIQTILFKLQKIKMESTNLQKQFEDLSINFNNINKNKNNNSGKDELITNAIKTLNEKYKNILFKIKAFIINTPVLINLREEYLKIQLNNLSYQKIKKKGINKTLSISNFKNKNNNIFGNYKNNIVSNRNISINDYISSNSKKIKIDILKNKIKSIQINFDGSQFDSNEKNSYIFDKGCITPSNEYMNDLTFKNFVKNEINTNIINNLNSSTSREKLLFIPKNQSFIKNKNQNVQNNMINKSQNQYQNSHINKSCNNSSINLSVINHKHKNKKIINNINKMIPNNYRRKPQMNSLENNKNNENTNPNTQNCRHKTKKKIKNNNSFNFPIKNIIFDTKLIKNKRMQYKKIKPNILLRDKIIDKEIINFTTSPTCQIQKSNNNNNNNIKTNNNNKVLYNKPIQKEKSRSHSEYIIKSLKNEIKYSNSNNNSLNNHNKKLRGFSLDNLSWNKLEIQHFETNVSKKRRPIIRNRAINVLYDNSSNGAITSPNRNLSHNNVNNVANKKSLNNAKINFINFEKAKNMNDNENIIINYDTFINTREENKKLKTEVISLKKEIEKLKYMYQDLSLKVSNLQEQNETLKKENYSIKFCNMYQK